MYMTASESGATKGAIIFQIYFDDGVITTDIQDVFSILFDCIICEII